MAKSNIVIQFICYSPRIYSGFDKYNLELAKILNKNGFQSVFVFSNSIEVKEITDDLLSEDVIIELISTKNKSTILRDVVKLFLKYRPVIVHSHFENYIQFITMLLSLIFGSKFFISFHSTISLLTKDEYREKKGVIKQILLRIYYRILIIASNKVLCISKAIKNQFNLFSGSDSAKIQYLYLGVKLQPNKSFKNNLRSLLSLPQDKILLCNVSAIEHIKGLDILIDAVKILKTEYCISNFLLCHIGGLRAENEKNEIYRENLFRKVKELQLEKDLLWLGQRNDVDKILSAFDVFVHPSRIEGLGVAIMEACVQSLPVVGTKVGGIPEIIFHNNNGFLFTPESAEELASYLSILIKDESVRKQMGKESFRIVEELFNIKKQTELLANLYFSSFKI